MRAGTAWGMILSARRAPASGAASLAMEYVFFPWWLWMLIGIVLMAGEILTPGGFYIIFFGAAAVIIGFLKLFGMELSLPMEGLVFCILSVVGVVFFRNKLQARFAQPAPEIPVDSLISQTAVAIEEIAPGAMGKVELRGTAWQAQNLGDAPIQKAERCRIERVEGLTLYVRSLKGA